MTPRRPLCFLLLAAFASTAWPQPAPAPEVARAQEQLAAGDAAAAAATLEAYFAKDPAAAQGRLLLGDAYRQAGQADEALAAYLAVPERPRPPRLQARFHAAVLHMAKGDRPAALALVEELAASGAFDMDAVRVEPAFAPLREDARFAAAMFSPDDFAQPFVEPTRILHEWRAEAKGDQFGWIARSLPDVDGDGAREVVTSAPTHGAAGAPGGPGRVYLYSGKRGGLLWSYTGRDQEGVGTGLEAAGDVDGDGKGDVAAGAPGGERTYVLSGATGKPLLTLAPPQPAPGFGSAATGVGDQDGDGHADVLVGAPGGGTPADGPGQAFLFSGKDGSLLLTLAGERPRDAFGSIVAGARTASGGVLVVGAPSAGSRSTGRVYVYSGPGGAPRFTIDSDDTGAALGGMFASVVGDVDRDGTPDVYASDFTNAAKGPATGRVYVHSGRDGRRLLTLTGDGPGDGFGVGPADAGDVDRDGFDDLVIGAWQFAGAAGSGGRITVHSGKDGRLLRTITGRVPGETLGFDATGAGDVDGDGAVDLLVTSAWSNVNGYRSGRVYLISGR